ncbi:hypothetical protein N0V90_001137 [Kalmusia sp. IMI 367209]|nr:hypothetical protein N0V90_001137 [Kalmusia sp. IMI 367209]
MQAMMNLVLISSGRYMKTARQPAEAARMQFTLKRAVSAANERFQDSLDELENEIRLAQAVLRRDLALLRADRKQKEAAVKEKAAEKARLAAESSAKKNVPLKKEESPAPPKPASPPPAKTEPAEPVAADTALHIKETAAQKASPPPADVPMENADNPHTAQESEFDFDAIFGDGAMDTSGDGANDDLNLDTVGADLNFTLDDQPSLLRGLEDFAKDSTDDNSGQNNESANLDLDFAMPDMPSMDVPATKPQEDTAVQQTTSTDDLNLDTMPTDDLDDLFGLDYENPEATQFDDAFFGFGDGD